MEQHMDMVTTSASVSVSEEVASAVPPPPPTLHWEVQCQRVTITNDKVEILTLLRDIIRTYDTTISKLWPTATTTTATAAAAAGPEYRSFITTILPLCSHCLINKTTPTPDILSVDHQIRQLILEFIHALVQTHTTTGTVRVVVARRPPVLLLLARVVLGTIIPNPQVAVHLHCARMPQRSLA